MIAFCDRWKLKTSLNELLSGGSNSTNETTEVPEAVSGGCDIYTPVGPLSLLLTLFVSLFFSPRIYHFDASLQHRKRWENYKTGEQLGHTAGRS